MKIIECKNISKNFGGVQALKNVSVDIYQGEILALIGENGAGKSTLAKIFAGVHQASTGTVLYKGEKVSFKNTQEARAAGITIVLQEFSLIPHLSIAENIFLANESMYRKHVWQNRKLMEQETWKLFEKSGIDFNLTPDMKISDLTVAEQQYVEIVKSLSWDSELMILDEPTSALSRSEVIELFKLVHSLKDRGITIIFVSHKLEEIFELSDRIIVFRDGEYITQLKTDESNEKELISAMVGRDLGNLYHIRNRKEISDEVVLGVKGLKNGMSDTPYDFDLHKGEIIGFSGLVGAGRTELARAIFGADTPAEGSVLICGEDTFRRPIKFAISCGCAMLPEDRKLHGVILEQSILFNISLSALVNRKGFFINSNEELKQAEELIDDLQIKIGSINHPVSSLSGGNQQKVALAKWLNIKPDVLLLDEPTRGIDIGAKFEIYQLIDELAARGTAIFLVSSELPEILALSDRIFVMQHGDIVKEYHHSEATENNIMYYSTLGHTEAQ